jgi:hypothetical protein
MQTTHWIPHHDRGYPGSHLAYDVSLAAGKKKKGE